MACLRRFFPKAEAKIKTNTYILLNNIWFHRWDETKVICCLFSSKQTLSIPKTAPGCRMQHHKHLFMTYCLLQFIFCHCGSAGAPPAHKDGGPLHQSYIHERAGWLNSHKIYSCPAWGVILHKLCCSSCISANSVVNSGNQHNRKSTCLLLRDQVNQRAGCWEASGV